MTPDERIAAEITELVHAAKDIAAALTASATIAQKFYDKLYPERKDVRDATITIVETQEQKNQRERLQGSEATNAEWADLGPREAEFLKSTKPRT